MEVRSQGGETERHVATTRLRVRGYSVMYYRIDSDIAVGLRSSWSC